MKQNIGTTDRMIRIAVAVIIALLYTTGTIGGVLAAVLGIVALLLIVTSVVGFCPAYTFLGLSTKKKG